MKWLRKDYCKIKNRLIITIISMLGKWLISDIKTN